MTRVYVGMSGGVDSSLTAALLKEQGYDVTGVYMKNWTQDLPGLKCPWADDLADAKRVAVQLGIDFEVYDFEAEYKQKVVDYMIDEYKIGRTPNPDIMCNQEVKFRLFLDTALENGADLIATGHYANVANRFSAPLSTPLPSSQLPPESSRSTLVAGPPLRRLATEIPRNGFAPGLIRAPAPDQPRAADVPEDLAASGSPTPTPARVAVGGAAPAFATLAAAAKGGADQLTGPESSDLRAAFVSAKANDGSGVVDGGNNHIAQLIMAKDQNKDQTYFLYRVTGEALQKTLFPLGGFTKPEVRKMAQERGLTTAAKPDSQGICFVGQIGIRDFLSEYVEQKPGVIVDKQSGKIVGHHDGAIFYTLGQRHGLDVGGGLPYYVVGKDMDKNEVYVSRDLQDESLWRYEIQLSNIHWINPPSGGQADGDYQIRVRHRAPLVTAHLAGDTLHLDEPQRAVAAGQSIVIYDGDVCLGGGIVA